MLKPTTTVFPLVVALGNEAAWVVAPDDSGLATL
jgi:hypothetical protein